MFAVLLARLNSLKAFCPNSSRFPCRIVSAVNYSKEIDSDVSVDNHGLSTGSTPDKPDVNHESTSITTAESPDSKITLKETDFVESFVKGSGPGGSKVNKTKNCVELKHIESGIVVQCHERRTLEENRKIARIRLIEKLKQKYTPLESDIQKKIETKRKRKGDAYRKRMLKEEAVKNRKDW